MFERLAIVGTGAIGSVIGGYLSRAGRDVTLIDTWAEHVDAMNADGPCMLRRENGEFTTGVNAMHLGDVNTVVAPFDAIFLAVKSYDTVWATHFAMRYLTPTGIIISAPKRHQRRGYRADSGLLARDCVRDNAGARGCTNLRRRYTRATRRSCRSRWAS